MSRLSVAEPTVEHVTLPDGATLVAEVYRPVGEGPRPVLLMRQPYGRRIGSTVVLAHPAWYASQGFVVAVQDVRGTGGSGGDFVPFATEAADGAASLDWAAGLAGGDGRVALYGFSYHAGNQFLALAEARRRGGKVPDAMVPVMGAFDPAEDWVYEGGAMRLAGQLLWASQMAAGRARHAGDAEAEAAFANDARGAPWTGERAAHPSVHERYARYSHLARWRDTPECLAEVSAAALLADDPLDVPAFHIGGWQDFLLGGTMASYGAFAERSAAPQQLLVGPWQHIPWSRKVGERDLGAAAALSVDSEIVAFLRHTLGTDEANGSVRLFDVGTREWRRFAAVPETAEQTLYLGSGGLAATTAGDGTLGDAPGRDEDDLIVHDPWRPAPAVGGPLGIPAGYVDRTQVDHRADVACYTSAPLAVPITLLGDVEASIYASADHPSFDLHATLSMVSPDGVPLSLSTGVLRVTAPAPPYRVRLRPLCVTLPKGWALRLSLQLAAWPAFAINPGTGLRPEDARIADLEVVTARVLHGPSRASSVTLRVLEG